MSEQLELPCDTRHEGGPEGFVDLLEEMSLEEVESLFGEAADALLDAQDEARAGDATARQRLQQ